MNENKGFTRLDIGSFENFLEQKQNEGKGKFFMGQELGLTSCKVSLNRLPAGKGNQICSRSQNE